MQRSEDWQWDSLVRLWYRYDPRLQHEVFEDGSRRETKQPRNFHRRSRDDASAAHQDAFPSAQNSAFRVTAQSSADTPTNLALGALRPPSTKRSVVRGKREPQLPEVWAQDFATLQLNSSSQPPVHNETKEWTASNGDRLLDVRNPVTDVQTTIMLGPVARITDPNLLQKGIRASQMLLTTSGESETLYADYKRRAQPRRFFTVGKVFRVLWSEPAGDDRTSVTFNEGVFTGRYRERVFSKVRLFVVIREGDNFCSALPIATYRGQGTSRSGVTKSDFSIIYTGRSAPSPLNDEVPQRGEKSMRPDAIRVNPDDRSDRLDERSRINYAKVYTIEHNIKVKPYGQVHPASEPALRHQFLNVWLGEAATSAATQPSNEPKLQHTSTPVKREDRRPNPQASNSATAESINARAQAARRPGDDRKFQAIAAVQRFMRAGLTQQEAIDMVQEVGGQHRGASGQHFGSTSGYGSDVFNDSDDDDSTDSDVDDSTDSDVENRRAKSTKGVESGSHREYPRRISDRPRVQQRPPRPVGPSQPANAAGDAQRPSQIPHVSIHSTTPSQSERQGQSAAQQPGNAKQPLQANVHLQVIIEQLTERDYSRDQAWSYIATAVSQLVERGRSREQALQHLASSLNPSRTTED